MPNILKIEDAVKGYFAITVSDQGGNKVYTVRETVYMDVGAPCRGEELSYEVLDILIHADEYYRAKRAALSILSYGDNNERTLHTKLRARSISDETATEVVSEMVSLGYINESRQLERIITDEANRRLQGPKKIIPKLLSKGYSISNIRHALESLVDSGEVDFEKNRELLLDRLLGSERDSEQVKKLLFKYGYDF